MSDPFRFIQFQFCDLLGHMRAMIVPCKPASSLEEVAEDPVMSEGTSIDGSSAGFATVEASDLKLIPDPSTLVEIPYLEHRTAAVMCYVERKGKGGTYPLDSRGVLRSVCSRLLTSRRQLMVKTEPEFYFISSDGELVDHARYADVYPLSPAADALTEIAAVVQDMGMRVRVVHHEAGESQQEIELDYDDTIRMADNLLRFKNVARAITRERGLDVTFMPKPFEDMAGSGLHCHMQLWEGDRNLFGAGEGQLSETAEMFAAGLLKHAPAITAIANPTVNSYKRLVPHHEAPVYICWGPVNRTVLIRIPLFTHANKAAMEFRSADPLCNPYLLFSAIVAAGMDGVTQRIAPPEPVKEDVFRMSNSELEERGIGTLPTTLDEALNELERDSAIVSALGKEIVEAYVKVKRDEWDEYRSRVVTDWEWERYAEM